MSTRHYSIREVVQLLSSEFEISESNLRYWEKEGLIEPGRSPGGHRIYSEEDIERIRLIHLLKTKRYLPLMVIKQFCNSSLPAAQLAAHFEGAVDRFFRPLNYDPAFIPMDPEAVQQRFGFSPEDLDRLTDMGLIGEKGPYDEDDIRLLEIVQTFRQAGFAPDDFALSVKLIEQLAQDHLSTLLKQPCRPMKIDPQLFEDWFRILFRKAALRTGKRFAEAGFFKKVKGNKE